MLQVEAIETAAAGHRGYLIHDGETGVVVDPPWDAGQVTSLAARLGVAISLVAETHLHPGQLLPGGPTCGSALARQTGARYAVSAAHKVCPRQLSVADKDELAAGSLTVMVVATPGHTLSHLAVMLFASQQRQPQKHVRRNRIARWCRIVIKILRAADERFVIRAGEEESAEKNKGKHL